LNNDCTYYTFKLRYQKRLAQSNRTRRFFVTGTESIRPIFFCWTFASIHLSSFFLLERCKLTNSLWIMTSHQMRMNWNELKWIQIFRNINSRMLKWMLFNPEFLIIYGNCMEYISMLFNLKIILAFSVHNTHIMNIVQFKILNRKCSFSIQLHSIETN